MLALATPHGHVERIPHFPKRLEENRPRHGFFEHAEYLSVRQHLPRAFRDVLDFAYDTRNVDGWPDLAGMWPKNAEAALKRNRGVSGRLHTLGLQQLPVSMCRTAATHELATAAAHGCTICLFRTARWKYR